jgi:hypothetical protein
MKGNLCNISKVTENAIKAAVQQIAQTMLLEYDIYKRGTRDRPSIDDIINIMYDTRTTQSKVCKAITQSGSRCLHKAQSNSEYCGLHVSKAFSSYGSSSNVHSILIDTNENEFEQETNEFDHGKHNFELKFIEDTFYYVDDNYVYERETITKCGYKDVDTGEFILTDDPFILNTM